jgi:FRG domain-containing protein
MDAWTRFLGDVDAARAKLGIRAGTDTWFRGHASSDWPLLPSLFRFASKKDVPDLEADLYYEFAAKARELHSARLDSWETLFIMRHHGVATRILDWTEQFGTALYFALRDWSDATGKPRALPAIWILNPFRLNKVRGSWGGEYLVSPRNLFDYSKTIHEYVDVLSSRSQWPYVKPVAIYPRQVSSRQQAQSGWFTIHGSDQRPLDEIASSAVQQIQLKPDVIAEGKKFLDRAGFNDYLMFPDLDGLARSLHDKYITRPAAARARAAEARASKRRGTRGPR